MINDCEEKERRLAALWFLALYFKVQGHSFLVHLRCAGCQILAGKQVDRRADSLSYV